MDFSKPTQAMREKAEKHKIKLDDPLVIEEFKTMQMLNLEDLRRMILGKPQLSEQDMKQERANTLTKL